MNAVGKTRGLKHSAVRPRSQAAVKARKMIVGIVVLSSKNEPKTTSRHALSDHWEVTTAGRTKGTGYFSVLLHRATFPLKG